MKHKINKEIIFGLGTSGQEISAPNPLFCNLKLAVMRVLYASGAAEVLEQFWKECDRVGMDPSSLGVSQELDELFLDKLAVISVF
jgi:hypothetical protein